MEGWVGLVGWPVADVLPTKWSHVNHGSGVDQGKSASYRPTFLPLSHAATQRTHFIFSDFFEKMDTVKNIMGFFSAWMTLYNWELHHFSPRCDLAVNWKMFFCVAVIWSSSLLETIALFRNDGNDSDSSSWLSHQTSLHGLRGSLQDSGGGHWTTSRGRLPGSHVENMSGRAWKQRFPAGKNKSVSKGSIVTNLLIEIFVDSWIIGTFHVVIEHCDLCGGVGCSRCVSGTRARSDVDVKAGDASESNSWLASQTTILPDETALCHSPEIFPLFYLHKELPEGLVSFCKKTALCCYVLS